MRRGMVYYYSVQTVTTLQWNMLQILEPHRAGIKKKKTFLINKQDFSYSYSIRRVGCLPFS